MSSFFMNGAAWAGVVGLVAVGAVSSGCSANVTTFGECTYNGEAYDVGDSFPATDGCNTCTCEAGGSVSCTEIGCTTQGCDYGGVFHAVGESFDAGDGCNTCTCGADSQVSCTTIACGNCDGPPPECPQPNDGCSAYPVCDGGGWTCVTDCSGCEGGPPPCPAPPDGCFYDGPYCVDGSWTCGELVCEACAGDPPVCPDPGDPSCWVELQCTDFGWDCVTFCDGSCEDQYPDGAAIAVELVIDYCACQDAAPCVMECSGTEYCGGNLDSFDCEVCLQERVDNQDACVLDAVTSDECQGNQDCSNYINCVLSQG